MRDRIPIDKTIMPYRYTIPLGRDVFSLEFQYNSRRDCFSCNLRRNNVLICAGERLVYGMPLFANSYQVAKHPITRIVPYDESGTVDTVNWATLGKYVFLTVDNQRAGEAGA